MPMIATFAARVEMVPRRLNGDDDAPRNADWRVPKSAFRFGRSADAVLRGIDYQQASFPVYRYSGRDWTCVCGTTRKRRRSAKGDDVMTMKQAIVTGLSAAGLVLAGGLGWAAGQYGPGASDTEIKIGNTVPYAGRLRPTAPSASQRLPTSL